VKLKHTHRHIVNAKQIVNMQFSLAVKLKLVTSRAAQDFQLVYQIKHGEKKRTAKLVNNLNTRCKSHTILGSIRRRGEER